jgi:hypothetical protein
MRLPILIARISPAMSGLAIGRSFKLPVPLKSGFVGDAPDGAD